MRLATTLLLACGLLTFTRNSADVLDPPGLVNRAPQPVPHSLVELDGIDRVLASVRRAFSMGSAHAASLHVELEPSQQVARDAQQDRESTQQQRENAQQDFEDTLVPKKTQRSLAPHSQAETRSRQTIAVDELPIAEPIEVLTQTNKVFFLPADCLHGRNTYDLVVHFHGAPPVVGRAYREARLDAVLVILNEGIASNAYRDRFYFEDAFPTLIRNVNALVNERCNSEPHAIGRIALSAWSAGYASIQQILKQGAEDRIDAILLSDGLHARLSSRAPRRLNSASLEPFVRFAKDAASGERLFAFTHSAIRPPTYAGTTETADYLLKRLRLEREPSAQGRGHSKMRLRSSAHRRNFHVLGYKGQTAEAHGDHLRALGKTVFPLLRDFWSSTKLP